jgi:hypothetical protein
MLYQQRGDTWIEALKWKHHMLSKENANTALASQLLCAQIATDRVFTVPATRRIVL